MCKRLCLKSSRNSIGEERSLFGGIIKRIDNGSNQTFLAAVGTVLMDGRLGADARLANIMTCTRFHLMLVLEIHNCVTGQPDQKEDRRFLSSGHFYSERFDGGAPDGSMTGTTIRHQSNFRPR